MNIFQKARTFIYRHARPLDFARWQYHFENGSAKAVLNALTFYQNEDGGFGHALEADAWNPYSSPIQTWAATEILHEIGFTDALHPIISGILRYLSSGKDFNGGLWYNTVKSNNDYPHAPWWHTESDSTCHHDYNPTASLAGFIIRFADKKSDLYQLGSRIVKEAYEHFQNAENHNDMHTIGCYVSMLEDCRKAGFVGIDMNNFEEKLCNIVSESITKNTAEWEQGYVCMPSQFISGKDSPFYTENKEIVDDECDFILRTQLADGSWHIPWGWNAYPDEWAISKNWWKSNGIIGNLLYLEAFGRLGGKNTIV